VTAVPYCQHLEAVTSPLLTATSWDQHCGQDGFALRTLVYMSFMVAGFLAALFVRRPGKRHQHPDIARRKLCQDFRKG
jgi:hypothetical protein